MYASKQNIYCTNDWCCLFPDPVYLMIHDKDLFKKAANTFSSIVDEYHFVCVPAKYNSGELVGEEKRYPNFFGKE